MGLGYFKTSLGNVGDDLNLWLWPKMLPTWKIRESNIIDENVLVGIGSILDDRFNLASKKTVIGSGARSEASIPELDDSWEILFVRGPKTAKALSKYRVVEYITDPAILSANFFTQSKNPQAIGLIPYFRSNQQFWSDIADKLNWKFISPCLPLNEFMHELAQCEYVVTEAMHGAILADSLRIPWISYSSFTRYHEGETHSFKWNDWSESMKLNNSEIELPVIWNNKSGIKQYIKQKWIIQKLKALNLDKCYLSSDETFNQKLNKMNSKLQIFDGSNL